MVRSTFMTKGHINGRYDMIEIRQIDAQHKLDINITRIMNTKI